MEIISDALLLCPASAASLKRNYFFQSLPRKNYLDPRRLEVAASSSSLPCRRRSLQPRQEHFLWQVLQQARWGLPPSDS